MTDTASDPEFDALLVELQREDPPPQGDFVPDPIPDEVWIKVRNTLGIKQERWDAVKQQVIARVLPKYGLTLTGITAGISMNVGFETVEHMLKAIDNGRKLMESPDKDVDNATRIAAGRMMALASDALAKVLAQVVGFSEKHSPQESKPQPAGQHRHLPPLLPGQLNVQVNVGGAPSPAPPASTVKHLPPEIPSNSAVVISGRGES